MLKLNNISFKGFLLNENKAYLGTKLGDILSAIQDLTQNSEGMGTRQLVANAERLVNQIRRILHSKWSKKEQKYLVELQAIGVAIARAIEEKSDLAEVLPNVASSLEQLLSKLGEPLHSLGSEEDAADQEIEDNQDSVAPPQGNPQDLPSKDTPQPKEV